MATYVTLQAAARTPSGKKVKTIRRDGRIPGVLYGFNVGSQPLECNAQEFHKTYVRAGENTVIDLSLEGKAIPVLIHHIDVHPVTGRYAHVDFLALDLTKEVTAPVPLKTVGDAPGVKDLGAILVHARDTLTVRCLPKDLPHAIEVDISTLKNFHDAITVEALKIPANVKVMEKPEEILIVLQPPRKEEEAAPAVEAEGAPVEGAPAVEGAAETQETPAASEGAGKKPEAKKEAAPAAREKKEKK